MDSILWVFLVSFGLSFLAILILKPFAIWAQLVDKPGGRKKHKGLIPLVGGLAVYVSVLTSSFLFLDQQAFVRLFMVAGSLIVFIGMLDDRYELSPRVRLLAQFLISSIFVYGLDVHVASLGNLFGFGEVQLGWLGYPFTLIALMSAINAFNMMDGMDGLVGSISVVSLAGLAALYTSNGNWNFAFLCIIFVGSLLAFLVFNLASGQNGVVTKIFMGDAGSMFMGLSIGVLIVYGSQQPLAAFSPSVSLWLIFLPLVDMLTIMYRRIKRGRSPMAADRTHLHHIIMRAGFSPKSTLTIMFLAQCGFVFLGVIFYRLGMPELASLIMIVVFVTVYQLLMLRSWRLIRWARRRTL